MFFCLIVNKKGNIFTKDLLCHFQCLIFNSYSNCYIQMVAITSGKSIQERLLNWGKRYRTYFFTEMLLIYKWKEFFLALKKCYMFWLFVNFAIIFPELPNCNRSSSNANKRSTRKGRRERRMTMFLVKGNHFLWPKIWNN